MSNVFALKLVIRIVLFSDDKQRFFVCVLTDSRSDKQGDRAQRGITGYWKHVIYVRINR